MQLWTDPGEFRHVVAAQTKGTATGSMGEVTETWTLYKNIRCKIWTVRGDEAERAKRETGKAIVKLRCRYNSWLNQGMRLVLKNRVLDITNINNLEEMNQEIEITAEETI